MFVKRLADNTNQHSLATQLRRRRFQLLLEMLADRSSVSILDVGGRPAYWKLMTAEMELSSKLDITLVNLAQDATDDPDFRSVVGDARALAQFADQEFDIVFSNSTIEHVGDFDDQQRMANEIRRVGKQYYVQTPNRNFPIEPHFIFPMFQFLPISVRAWLVQHFQLGWCAKLPDREQALREVKSITLLNKAEFHSLFPEGLMHEEKLFGLVKSFVAYTKSSPAQAGPHFGRSPSRQAAIAS